MSNASVVAADRKYSPWFFRRVRERVMISMLLLILVLFSWLTVKQGLADSVAEEALQHMLTWQTDTLTTAQVQQAYELMLEANELDAGHPTYLHRLGRLSHLLMALDLKKRADWGALAKT